MAIFQKSAASSGNQAAAQRSESGDGARLHVGRDLRLQGSVENCDTLVIEGYMKASSVRSKQVIIAESGVLEGEVGADSVEVRGRFSGTLLARKLLDVRASGDIEGEISYGALAVERGGRLSGRIGCADAHAEAGTGETKPAVSAAASTAPASAPANAPSPAPAAAPSPTPVAPSPAAAPNRANPFAP